MLLKLTKSHNDFQLFFEQQSMQESLWQKELIPKLQDPIGPGVTRFPMAVP